MRTLSLAARNLLRNLRRTLLTGAAIAFGLSMMILSITLANGQYQAMMRSGISVLAGHVVVEHPDYDAEAEPELVVTDVEARAAILQDAFPNAHITQRLWLGGLLTSPSNSIGVGLQGVEPVAEAAVSELDEKLVDGEWLTDNTRGILVGKALAERLAVGLGDKVVFMGQGEGGDVESRLFRVSGIFESGAAEQDAFVAITHLAAAQELNRTPDSAHQLGLQLKDARTAEQARARVVKQLEGDLAILTWDEKLSDLVAMIRIDRISNDVMLFVIGIIVAMGVLNTVLMSVLERIKEFGVLMAVGMRPRQVSLLVLAEGLVLGIIATGVGIVLGLLFSYPLVTYGVDLSSMAGGSQMETSGVAISAVIKGAYDPTRTLQYAVAAVAMTLLSAAYPAWYITRLNPVQAMRYGA